MGHAHHMVAGFVVLEFGGAAQAADDLLAGGNQFSRPLFHHALELPGLVVEGQMGAPAHARWGADRR